MDNETLLEDVEFHLLCARFCYYAPSAAERDSWLSDLEYDRLEDAYKSLAKQEDVEPDVAYMVGWDAEKVPDVLLKAISLLIFSPISNPSLEDMYAGLRNTLRSKNLWPNW